MSMYDFTFLLNDKEELKNLKTLIAAVNGKAVSEEEWGKKTLSYPIKKQLTADFYNWQLDLDETQIQELKKRLNLNEKLMRYLLLKVDPRTLEKKPKAKKSTKAE